MASRIAALQRQQLSRPSLRLSRQLPLARQWPSIARHSSTASSTSEAAAKTASEAADKTTRKAKSTGSRVKNYFWGSTLLLVGTAGYLYSSDTRASFHQWLVPRVIRTVWPDAEEAHHVGTKAMETMYRFGIHQRERGDPDAAGDLQITVFGHTLDNPIGISAGLDKNAEIPDPLFALGPAVVEVGGITPMPQEGNAQPRCFRVPSQQALINRYGLNSEGADNVAQRLRQRVREFAYQIGFGIDTEGEQAVLDGLAGVPPGSLTPGKIMCVQVAKNKNTPEGDIEAVKNDYVYCVDRLARYADVIVVNVSSPNTPGLRTLQRHEPLTRILSGVVGSAKAVDRKTKPAVMVKVSPDEDSDEQVSGICEAVWDSGIDGIIVGNTTKQRPEALPKGYLLSGKEQHTMLEQGGYSGPQMFDRTLSLVAKYRHALDQGPIEKVPVEEEQPKAIEQAPAAEPEEPSTVTVAGPVPHSAPASRATFIEEAHEPTSPLEVAVADAAAPAAAAAAATNPFDHPHKEIWATGGVATGQQALQLLNAGASVAMIYTTMVYNGSGTVTRIKNEMRRALEEKR
ncbi:uncharacterized protein K452DRAFT_258268 [Aplosporella prunicola CBS 121167]|uniref:Dihydroorotate dehydrogenase (quinone), mitochondrial n=1 Tax=Aplosporella prunicola CBS 121167 TaxID=1176127 RepID=A0A6A6B196_9PEZI|nr:uncharacterized protein K452DRAFT_258268 [Aplosporella prunicola CBS 121167]KAF2136994.1 hypothetical protein K452DRAFT_258268 [Aplosporella prunicola CBS 121167]